MPCDVQTSSLSLSLPLPALQVTPTKPPVSPPIPIAKKSLGEQAVAAQAKRESKLPSPAANGHSPASPAPGSKLPSASPQRFRKPSPGPTRPKPGEP